jgi:hypothetical protein
MKKVLLILSVTVAQINATPQTVHEFKTGTLVTFVAGGFAYLGSLLNNTGYQSPTLPTFVKAVENASQELLRGNRSAFKKFAYTTTVKRGAFFCVISMIAILDGISVLRAKSEMAEQAHQHVKNLQEQINKLEKEKKAAEAENNQRKNSLNNSNVKNFSNGRTNPLSRVFSKHLSL